MRSSAESPHSAPQQSPKPSRTSSAPSPAPTMSESPDVEMGGVGIETTNGHSRHEGIADNGGSDHVTSEHSEAEEETFRGPSNLGDTSLSKNINGDPTPAGSKHTSAETMSNRSVEATSLPVNGESPASGIPRKDKAESRPVNGEAHLSGGSRRSATCTSPRKPPTTTPSKSLQASSESIKMSKEEARLKEVLSETSAQVMQKVLRGEWRSFLFEGFSEDHISFVLRAILKNSARSPRIVDNVLNDLPTLDKLLDRPAVVSKILGSASYTQILKHVSTDVLDQALAERLKTVDAKDLVNYLARANRLGYGPDDVLDEADEHVTCIIASTSQEVPEVLQVEVPRPQRNIPPSQPNAQNDMQQDPLLLEQQRNRTVVEKKYAQIGTCPECHETFPTFAGYTYHVSKKKCGKEGKPVDGWKFWCDNCKTGFTGKQGKEYHVMNNVCNRSDNIAPATSPSGQLQQEAQQSHPAIRVPSNTQLSQPIPPTRPPMYQQPNNSVPTPSQQGPQAPLTRPPIHKPAPTPNTPASGKKKFRRLVSELTPQESEALHSDLNREIQRYNQSVIDLKAKYSGTDLENRLTTAHNGHGTKMSNIRNSHGVTLRMRQKEKDERIAAGYTPPSNSQVGQIKAISGNSPRNSSPLVPSFSPVNGSGSKSGSSAPRAPPMSQPARMPYLPSHFPNPAGYTAPPMGGALRAPNQYSPPHPDPLIHTRAGIDNPSPYGVMKLTDVRSPNPNKRRRSSEDGSSPRPNGPASAPRPQPWFANTQNRTVSQPQPSPSAPGLSMMEMRSEDAASKLAGYYKTLNKPETNHGPSNVRRPDSSGRGATQVIVLTDSETDEGESAPAITSVPLITEPASALAPSIEKDDDTEDVEEED